MSSRTKGSRVRIGWSRIAFLPCIAKLQVDGGDGRLGPRIVPGETPRLTARTVEDILPWTARLPGPGITTREKRQ